MHLNCRTSVTAGCKFFTISFVLTDYKRHERQKKSVLIPQMNVKLRHVSLWWIPSLYQMHRSLGIGGLPNISLNGHIKSSDLMQSYWKSIFILLHFDRLLPSPLIGSIELSNGADIWYTPNHSPTMHLLRSIDPTKMPRVSAGYL